ncbi:hypothetical protein TsFJ059_007326, partial [Trichoderma semiorbis]
MEKKVTSAKVTQENQGQARWSPDSSTDEWMKRRVLIAIACGAGPPLWIIRR